MPMPLPLLPPAFQLVALDRDVDAFARACRLAPRGLEDGTVYWTDRADRLRLALVLEPDALREQTLQAVYVLAVAVGDALGAVLPPQVPLTFAWPGGILLDGARLGQIRAAVAPSLPLETPPWLVLGLDLDVGTRLLDPGLEPERTSLVESGADEEVSPARLLESVTRHLLAWAHRWQEEGLAPVRAAWNARCHRGGDMVWLGPGEPRLAGEIAGLDEAGRFRIGETALSLETALEALR